jgi:hypothetical protein
MEQVIVNGVSASGFLKGIGGHGYEIKSIEIDVPLNEVGTTDPAVTVSGSVTGAYTFHSDTTLELRFGRGEDIYITTNSFTAEYSAVIRYVTFEYGWQRANNEINSPYSTIPTPWRFR